jgi:hypothetical protein
MTIHFSSFGFEGWMLARIREQKAKSQFKQIGVPHFNTGRENLPVKSGAGKLKSLSYEG